jgi:glycosyltransferase involved in cell wall biosynthesis
MKVIYIGNYKDGTGWGNAALNNILAMDKVGIDVVPRCITFNNQPVTVPERILELESKSSRGADTVIQHTLPPLFSYNSNFKNICLYETETTDITQAMWPKFINQLDEAWVPNQKGKETSLLSKVKIPIEIVPHCINVDEYDIGDRKTEVFELQKSFNFIFVGECVERKNIEALLKAFHTEFHPKENVKLVIKTSMPNVSRGDQFQILNDYTNQIKDRLKIRKRYGGDVIVADRLDRIDYIGLLKNAHCFVMPSRGEACCIPAVEAGVMGIPVIYTSDNGMEDYVDTGNNSVAASWEPCYNSMSSPPELHTGRGYWREISVSALRDKMREIYSEHILSIHEYDKRCDEQKKKAMEFSHEKVGEIIKEKLS